jgi:predicted metalloprotease
MEWRKGRRSDNVVDARGEGGGGGGMRFGGGKGLGLGAILLIVGIGWLTGQDPLQILGQLTGQMEQQQQQTRRWCGRQGATGQRPAGRIRRLDPGRHRRHLESPVRRGRQTIPRPQAGAVQRPGQFGLWFASAAVGPFYCPADQRVYLDMSFFREMETRFAAAGDFAQAYVIAHEIGHHVQTLLGVSAKVDAARRSGQRMEGDNGLLVRQELQADCLAGVWAYQAQKRLNWLEPGDVEEALNAANAIGDDRLQQQGRGRVVPDSFTHGTSAQRVRWFKAGFARVK